VSAGASSGAFLQRGTLGGLAAWGADVLARESQSPRLDAELLLARAAGLQRSAIIAFPERSVSDQAAHLFEDLVLRRREGVPVAYLLGEREFYSLKLVVGPAVLVPRPETELVVDAALEALGSAAPGNVLDLGTGSGAIALALKRERPRLRVTAVDVSPAALDLARRNAELLGLDIELVCSDWFAALVGRHFDVIVSNPPYIESDDSVLRGALRHEPQAALDGGPDGLDAIRAILAAASQHLESGGTLIVEHGETQGPAARALAAEHGLIEARTLADLGGRDRVLVARRV